MAALESLCEVHHPRVCNPNVHLAATLPSKRNTTLGSAAPPQLQFRVSDPKGSKGY